MFGACVSANCDSNSSKVRREEHVFDIIEMQDAYLALPINY